jgi:hypothetical protein
MPARVFHPRPARRDAVTWVRAQHLSFGMTGFFHRGRRSSYGDGRSGPAGGGLKCAAWPVIQAASPDIPLPLKVVIEP